MYPYRNYREILLDDLGVEESVESSDVEPLEGVDPSNVSGTALESAIFNLSATELLAKDYIKEVVALGDKVDEVSDEISAVEEEADVSDVSSSGAVTEGYLATRDQAAILQAKLSRIKYSMARLGVTTDRIRTSKTLNLITESINYSGNIKVANRVYMEGIKSIVTQGYAVLKQWFRKFVYMVKQAGAKVSSWLSNKGKEIDTKIKYLENCKLGSNPNLGDKDKQQLVEAASILWIEKTIDNVNFDRVQLTNVLKQIEAQRAAGANIDLGKLENDLKNASAGAGTGTGNSIITIDQLSELAGKSDDIDSESRVISAAYGTMKLRHQGAEDTTVEQLLVGDGTGRVLRCKDKIKPNTGISPLGPVSINTFEFLSIATGKDGKKLEYRTHKVSIEYKALGLDQSTAQDAVNTAEGQATGAVNAVLPQGTTPQAQPAPQAPTQQTPPTTPVSGGGTPQQQAPTAQPAPIQAATIDANIQTIKNSLPGLEAAVKQAETTLQNTNKRGKKAAQKALAKAQKDLADANANLATLEQNKATIGTPANVAGMQGDYKQTAANAYNMQFVNTLADLYRDLKQDITEAPKRMGDAHTNLEKILSAIDNVKVDAAKDGEKLESDHKVNLNNLAKLAKTLTAIQLTKPKVKLTIADKLYSVVKKYTESSN